MDVVGDHALHLRWTNAALPSDPGAPPLCAHCRRTITSRTFVATVEAGQGWVWCGRECADADGLRLACGCEERAEPHVRTAQCPAWCDAPSPESH